MPPCTVSAQTNSQSSEIGLLLAIMPSSSGDSCCPTAFSSAGLCGVSVSQSIVCTPYTQLHSLCVHASVELNLILGAHPATTRGRRSRFDATAEAAAMFALAAVAPPAGGGACAGGGSASGSTDISGDVAGGAGTV
jgi:hypothetical protein